MPACTACARRARIVEACEGGGKGGGGDVGVSARASSTAAVAATCRTSLFTSPRFAPGPRSVFLLAHVLPIRSALVLSAPLSPLLLLFLCCSLSPCPPPVPCLSIKAQRPPAGDTRTTFSTRRILLTVPSLSQHPTPFVILHAPLCALFGTSHALHALHTHTHLMSYAPRLIADCSKAAQKGLATETHTQGYTAR